MFASRVFQFVVNMSQTYYRVKKHRKFKKLNSSKQCDKIENYNEQSEVDNIENNVREVMSDIGVRTIPISWTTPVRINVEEDDSEQKLF